MIEIIISEGLKSLGNAISKATDNVWINFGIFLTLLYGGLYTFKLLFIG